MKIAGSDGFNIAGHKISWTMIGALAAAIGAFLVWRQFQAGGVSAGAATDTSSSAVPASAGDLATDPVIMNLSQELAKTQADLASVGGGSGTPAAATSYINLPGALIGTVSKQPAAFENWLQANRSRGDVAGALASSRWTDLQGEFLRETNQYPKAWK